MAFKYGAPWYYAADGTPVQAVATEEGWTFPLATIDDDGLQLQIIDDPAQVLQLNTQALGFNPDDKRVNQDGSVSIMNPQTGQYEQAVAAGETGTYMPISMAQAQGLPIYQMAMEPKDTGTLGQFMDLANPLMKLASVAGGAGLIGNGINAFASGGLDGLVNFGTETFNNAVNRITSLPETIGNGFNNVTSTVTSGADGSNVLSDAVTNMDGFQTTGIDWGGGLPSNGIDTSFLNDPTYGAQNFVTDPVLGSGVNAIPNTNINRFLGGAVDLGNSGNTLPFINQGGFGPGDLGDGIGAPRGTMPPAPPPPGGSKLSLSDLMKYGLPLAGTVLGATAGSSKPAGTTTTVQDIPDWQKPYVTGLLDSARQTFQNQQGNPQAGLLANAGANQMQSTIRGDYLSPESNPWLQATFDKAARGLTDQYNYSTMPQLSRAFGNQQAFGGSSAYGEAFGKANQGLATGLADLGTGIYGGNYQSERGRQFTAGAGAPDYAASMSTQPYAGLQAYGNIVGRGFGSQTQQPYFSNPTGGAMSGLLGGYALSNMFGNKP